MKRYGGGPYKEAHDRFILGLILSALLLIILLFTWYGYTLAFHRPAAPREPIPFSHRVHAGEKKISCLLCHDTAISEARAGMPPLETCMLCHSRLIITFPPIRDLRDYYYTQNPVYWKRTPWAGEGLLFPDFVYFNHSVHLNRSIDCGHCHGPVDQMDRVVRIQDLNMGFCIGCHKYYNATHDCFACHR
ncbi:MAG TPA: cytochrome C [Desulfobacteraceae bacterium]|nr:cytochrome C [Desulfobacteraceae bacterium]